MTIARCACCALMLTVLVACIPSWPEAGRAPDPAPAPPEEVSPSEPEPAPEPAPVKEPGPSLEERWRRPFGVESRGTVAARAPRPVVLPSGEAPRWAAPVAAPRPEEAPVPADSTEEEAFTTHTVRAGDSLWGIARLYGVSMERIREINGLEGDRVRIGQVLRIPREEGR